MVVKIKQKSDGFAILFFISAQNSPRLPRLPNTSYKYSLFLFC